MKQNILKRLSIIILAISLLFSFVGCSSKSENNSESNNSNSTEQTTAVTTTAPIEQTTPITTTQKMIENPDFRNTKWGMTKDEVKASENIEASTLDEVADNELFYPNIKLLDYPCTMIYYFQDEKLYQGLYNITTEHSIKNDYISDYDNLKKNYIEVYGEPKKDNVVWKDDLLKDNPEDYGNAVYAGHLKYSSIWETDTTNIYLILSSDNYNMTFIVIYEQKGFVEKVDKTGI